MNRQKKYIPALGERFYNFNFFFTVTIYRKEFNSILHYFFNNFES